MTSNSISSVPATAENLSPAYLGLETIASEEAWGWGCLIIGIIRLLSLFINGFWVPPTFHIRSATSILSTFFWFSIVYGMIASGAATTGLAVYPWLLLTEIFCIFRTARDYRISIMEAKATSEMLRDERG